MVINLSKMVLINLAEPPRPHRFLLVRLYRVLRTLIVCQINIRKLRCHVEKMQKFVNTTFINHGGRGSQCSEGSRVLDLTKRFSGLIHERFSPIRMTFTTVAVVLYDTEVIKPIPYIDSYVSPQAPITDYLLTKDTGLPPGYPDNLRYWESRVIIPIKVLKGIGDYINGNETYARTLRPIFVPRISFDGIPFEYGGITLEDFLNPETGFIIDSEVPYAVIHVDNGLDLYKAIKEKTKQSFVTHVYTVGPKRFPDFSEAHDKEMIEEMHKLMGFYYGSGLEVPAKEEAQPDSLPENLSSAFDDVLKRK